MADIKSLNNQSVPPQVLIALAVIIIIAAAAFGYMGLYDPAVSDLQKAQKNLQTKANQLDELQQQEAEFLEYQKESDRLTARLDGLKSKIPSSAAELDHFLGSINQRARSSKIAKWTLFKQDGNIHRGEVDAIPIRMEFISTYEAALQFFWELASMGDGLKDTNREQLINIHDVTVVRESARKEDTATMVKVFCVAETYLYTGNISQPDAKKGKKK